MTSMWSRASAMVDHRLAMHLRVEPFRLLNTKPMISFTFDDIPLSAATLGAEMLDAHGATGTFYVAGGLIDAPAPYWQMAVDQNVKDLHAKGHEIGCHTFSHRRVCDLDGPSFSDEIDRNQRYFADLDSTIKVENFAYPFGYGSYARSQQLKTTFRSSRSIVPGINRDIADLQFLKSMPLVDRMMDRESIDRAVDEAIQTNGWLIFYTHDVGDQPSPWGCSHGLMAHALKAAVSRNVPILNMSEALRCAGA